jgi:hypothetical protein
MLSFPHQRALSGVVVIIQLLHDASCHDLHCTVRSTCARGHLDTNSAASEARCTQLLSAT